MSSLRFNGAFALALLFGVSWAAAEVFTVGEHGTYGMYPQDAVLDAIAEGGGNHEIKIEVGSYADVLNLSTLNDGAITITGGWDASFSSRTSDPSQTLLTGFGGINVLYVGLGANSGELHLGGLSFSNSTSHGGELSLAGTVRVYIRNCRFVDSVVTMTVSAEAVGAGLRANLYDSSGLLISGCEFSGNSITATSSQSYGGGAGIWAEDDSVFGVYHSSFTANTVTSPAGSFANGGGLHILLRDNASGSVEDCVASGNTVAVASEAHGEGMCFAFNSFYPSTGSFTLRRLRVWDNTVGSVPGAAAQLWLEARESTTVLMSDSVVAGGDVDGIRAEAYGSGTLRLTNLTVADNTAIGIGMQANDVDHSSIHNTITWSNGLDFSAIGPGIGTADYYLSGENPNFRDAANRDYRIESPSPALDTGTDSPPAGLSDADAAGCQRFTGSAPEIGAYEYGSLFGDRFESGDTAAWDSLAAAP